MNNHAKTMRMDVPDMLLPKLMRGEVRVKE